MPDTEVRIVDLKLPLTVRKLANGYTATGRAARHTFATHAATADAAVAAWVMWATNGSLQEDE